MNRYCLVISDAFWLKGYLESIDKNDSHAQSVIDRLIKNIREDYGYTKTGENDVRELRHTLKSVNT